MTGLRPTKQLQPRIESRGDGGFLVGIQPEGDYIGPTAEVYIKGDWLYVVTDDQEGCAMLNLEALPALQRALQNLRESLGGAI